MKFFTNCRTLDGLKAEYRRLVKIHHPDRGGDAETMKQVNNDYEARFEVLKKAHNETHDAEHQTTEAPNEFIDIINALLKLDGLEVELCGSWLWIGGNTMEHKEALKALHCRWSSNKKLWYWRHVEDGAHWSRGKKSMNQIRAKYGSQVFKAGRESSNYDQLGETA